MIVAVMPAYNEEQTVLWAVRETKKYADKVVVVDDCSADATAQLARKAGAVVVQHRQNRGLGAALRTGFAKALAYKPDVIVTIDADGQHAPGDIPEFVRKINDGYDFVLGRRDLANYPVRKKIGNFFLNAATNFISGTSLRDTESGFRAFSRSGLEKLLLKAERYEIAAEIIFEVGRNDLKSVNIDISSSVYVQGVGVIDGFRNFFYLLHRRQKTWFDYLRDIKYVVKKHLHF